MILIYFIINFLWLKCCITFLSIKYPPMYKKKGSVGAKTQSVLFVQTPMGTTVIIYQYLILGTYDRSIKCIMVLYKPEVSYVT